MLLLIQLFRILTVAAGDSALVSIIITGSSDPNLGDSALCSSSGADLEFSSKLADVSEEIFFVLHILNVQKLFRKVILYFSFVFFDKND